MMNIHHLELFYYVARHGGISEAVRQMPYGIQQPAVSYQILQLEENLETTLFQRRPFALTPSGQKLYEFITPFFAGLEKAGDEIRGGGTHHLRLGAQDLVLREHFPEMLGRLRMKFPKLRLSLRDGYHTQLIEWVQKRELDLAVTLLAGKIPAGLETEKLVELPLVLLAPRASKLQSAAELWKRDRIDEPLVCLPQQETVTRTFCGALAERSIEWYPGIEVSSLALVEAYVVAGYGLGLSVDAPRMKRQAGIRVLPLPDFPTISVGAVWSGKPQGVLAAFLADLKQHAAQLAQPAG